MTVSEAVNAAKYSFCQLPANRLMRSDLFELRGNFDGVHTVTQQFREDTVSNTFIHV